MEEKKKSLGVQNPIHMLAKKLQENRKSLHIARVPDATKKIFIAFADKEFCGDYGMALKWLIDDIPSKDIRAIINKLEEQELRLQALESEKITPEDSPNENIKHMLDGTNKIVRRLKKNE